MYMLEPLTCSICREESLDMHAILEDPAKPRARTYRETYRAAEKVELVVNEIGALWRKPSVNL